MALTYSGVCSAILGGGNFWKKPPRFFCFSSVSGGNHSMGHGSPANQSGMKTRYFSAPLVARISAPWSVWGKNPKISKVTTMAFFASAGPVTSVVVIELAL